MASAALILWPFISMYIFSRLGVGRGVIWSMLIGYLFLPEAFGFDLPGIPSLAKPEFIVIGLFAGLAVSSSSRRLLKVPERKVIVTGLTWLLTILTLVSAAMTVSNNGSPIVFIESSLPGLTGADLRSLAFENLTLIAVFFIMKKYLNDTSLHREFLGTTVKSGV